ncbi:LacI family DNA-binding transcriptional regulator [Pseudonocardia sp. T1-2H]|uniref:LacI family DNA-binding transcriptional regulator n=1 Tax=Pseudonocardia sp. T1-2H TaxID=3128899 RepID=UPI003101200D
MKDVAEHARVSASTVSSVLDDSGPVTPERRNRVLDAVQVLEYSPNEPARPGRGELCPHKNRVHPTLSVVAWRVGGSAARVPRPCWSRAGPTAPRDGRSPGHPKGRPVSRRAGIARSPRVRPYGLIRGLSWDAGHTRIVKSMLLCGRASSAWPDGWESLHVSVDQTG